MKSLSPDTLANLAVASGATSPAPSGGAGSLIWSTTTNSPMVWTGGAWTPVLTGSSSGDVVGPSSSIDNYAARFDGATGKLIQSSLVLIDDTGSFSVTDGSGNAKSTLFYQSGVQSGFSFVSPNGSESAQFLLGDYLTQLFSTRDFQLATSGAHDLDFRTNGSTRLYITSGGNVSIAAPSSGSALAVAGETATGTLKLPAQASAPAAPASGNGLLYSAALAGRNLPRYRAPSGVSYALSPHFGGSNVRVWRGGASTTATTYASTIGALPYTSASPTAPSIPTLASTNLLTQTYRSTISTGATAGALAYIRGNQLPVWRGNAAGMGGFLVIHRVALSGTLQSGLRAFAGLVDVASNPTNLDPTSTATPGGVGIAVNANSGNWKLVGNVSGTARTATDLGASFPVNNTDLLELALWCAPNDSGINYQVTNLSTGNTTSGTLTTNIPASTTFLAPSVWVTNNATAAAQTMDFIWTYVETDY